jgi:L-ascorbate metabolism protein UlaG (beta-lactamase superfamily)
VEILYLGHSAFALRLASGLRIVVDPFLTGNPKASAKPADLADAGLVLLTHDHDDHLGDTIEICRTSGATLVAMFEVAMWAADQGVEVDPMGIGGAIERDGIVINMVNAQHSAGRGHPAGFVVEADDKNLYFAGDTALFGDMKMLGELWPLDLAVLPVGDRFTMGPRHAARAVELLHPKHVIPCHYATFDLLRPDAAEFARLAGEHARVHVLAPGGAVEL